MIVGRTEAPNVYRKFWRHEDGLPVQSTHMDDIRVIKNSGKTLAIFVRRNAAVPGGVRFPSEPNDNLQLGLFERSAEYRVKPHRHRELAGSMKIGEFIYVQSGKMKVTIFHDDWSVLAEEIVESGDCFLLLDGGHSVEMLEPSRFLEVKQGPYPGDKEAKIFSPDV